MSYRFIRPRRLRRNEVIRSLVRQTRLGPMDLVQPLFVRYGRGRRSLVESMPGQEQITVDLLVEEVRELWSRGVRAVILFGIPQRRDERGSDALSESGVVATALRCLKDVQPQMYAIADVCFCGYMDHGHCGVLRDGEVDNDATLELLQRQAVVYAKSGADMVAPSGMMDGMVGAIRRALDGEGYGGVGIMSYAVKYASSFYGPFREAACSAPSFGDRRGYQMDPANSWEALREVELDLEEGADIVMVKPAGMYLDVVYRVKERFGVPTAAYQVSGEYSMICAAAERGWLDLEEVALESLLCIRRAGADIIISYFTKRLVERLLC